MTRDNERLISDLLGWMQSNHADFTNTFLDLSQADKPVDKIYAQKNFTAWYEQWKTRLQQNTQPLESSLSLMKSSNPAVIPRNHKVGEALAAADTEDLRPFHALLNVLKEPYKNSDIPKAYQAPPLPSERIYQTFCGT